MKKIILASVIMFFVFSCKDKKQSEASVSIVETVIDSISVDKDKSPQIVTDTIRKFCTEDFYGIFDNSLIGMEASDEIEDSNPYEKCGVDYTGACYSTDLLKVEITKRKIRALLTRFRVNPHAEKNIPKKANNSSFLNTYSYLTN